MADVSQFELPLPSDTPSFIPPKWVSWLIALVPVFPPLYLAAFGSLKRLRTLPLTARYVLFFFASTQLVAALFTPRPLLSLGLAAARTLLILSMISAGVYLCDSRNLRPLLWGQLVIFVTAWGYTLYTQGFAGVQARLGHPYYYIVSLGLIAVIALWIIISWRGGSLWWRIPIGLFTFATFLAAGSRGPLLALLFGSIPFVYRYFRSNLRGLAIICITFTSVIILGSLIKIQFNPIMRLTNDQTTGRNIIWLNAIQGWQSSPIGGVGPYQGGPYLSYLYKDGCHLTPILEDSHVQCTKFLERWSSIWLIAHNAWLHWLLETGVIGFLGLLFVMIYGGIRVFRKSDLLLPSIFFGWLAMNTVDVVIAIPSQHFAELWWVILGMIISSKSNIDFKKIDQKIQ